MPSGKPRTPDGLGILGRLLDHENTYTGLIRPLDDNGVERPDAWILIVDGRIEISNAEADELGFDAFR